MNKEEFLHHYFRGHSIRLPSASKITSFTDLAERITDELKFGLGSAYKKAGVGSGEQRLIGRIRQAQPEAVVLQRDDDAAIEEFVLTGQVTQFPGWHGSLAAICE